MGTFRGSTTTFFADTQLPIYSIEINQRYFGYSKMRVKKFNNIKLFNDNSVNFLRNISKTDLFPKSNIFFYLDSHGSGDNLPLQEEVELIFENFIRPIVMIDDFEVPGTNYGFDNRLGHKLNLNFLNSSISKYNLDVFFPSINSEEETGSKRGMVLLCNDNEISSILEKNNYIYQYQVHSII